MDSETLRKNLPIIRAFAGWSTDDLAKMLGVSRQTIYNIETKKISTLQYLAISKLLDNEVMYTNNFALREAMNILDGGGRRNITKDQLVFTYERLKHEIGNKRGMIALRDSLRDWIVSC